MFYIDAPEQSDHDLAHCFKVTVPTYSSFEARVGEQVATIHAGSAALTLWTVKGIQVSDTPSDDPDDLRGVDGEYAYADGALGDRVIVTNDEHGEQKILPHMLMAITDNSDW